MQTDWLALPPLDSLGGDDHHGGLDMFADVPQVIGGSTSPMTAEGAAS
jgi:hypothetical protein